MSCLVWELPHEDRGGLDGQGRQYQSERRREATRAVEFGAVDSEQGAVEAVDNTSGGRVEVGRI
jgi:hypothetical protein